ERLLETARRSRYYIPILLAIATGMRRGEILALRWEDVDLEGGRISVRQTLVKTGDGLQFTDPKTDRSRRVIRIGPLLVQALRRLRAQQAQEKLRLGPAYLDRGLGCAQANGKPYDPAEFSKAFTSLAKRAGFPDLRFHDLRHSHATLLLRDGTPIKAVAERLGHASAAFTLDTYGHSLPDMQEAAARVVDALLSAPAENPEARPEASGLPKICKMPPIERETGRTPHGYGPPSLAGACGNRTHQGRSFRPPLVLKTRGNTSHQLLPRRPFRHE